MKLARIAVLAAAGLAVAAFAGVFQPAGARGQAADPASGGITVLGTGSTNVTPNRASFAFGTVSQARTAGAALAASSQATTRVVSALRQAGVARDDIQTSEVSLSPRTNENGDEIVGYTATNTVTANVHKLADAGKVIDAAVGAGANQMYGPNPALLRPGCGLPQRAEGGRCRGPRQGGDARERCRQDTRPDHGDLRGRSTAAATSGNRRAQDWPFRSSLARRDSRRR